MWRDASGSRCTTRRVRPALEPWRTVVEKSSRLRMRWTAVNKDGSGRQLGAALAPTICQDGAAGTRTHAETEAVLTGTAAVVGLVRTLAHEWFLTQGVESSQAIAPRSRIALPYGSDAKVGERVVDGHRSFTDLRPVNTRQMSRRPTSQPYGRARNRSNRRPYASAERVSSRHAEGSFSVCPKRLLWSSDAASVRAVFGLFHSPPGGRYSASKGQNSASHAVHTLWITMWIKERGGCLRNPRWRQISVTTGPAPSSSSALAPACGPATQLPSASTTTSSSSPFVTN